MRVTNQMMASKMLTGINNLRSYTASLSNQITTGERISKVSDDPVAGGEVMRIQSRGQLVTQWEASLANTKSWVRATEAKLGDITDLLNQAKELALTGANGSASDETRKALAPAGEQLLQNLMAALNEREPEGALFGGFATDANPFSIDLATGIVTYAGDSGQMQRDVGPGVTMTANISGDRMVDATSPDNMLTVVWELAEGLKAGDIAQVSGTLDRLDTARQTAVALRAEMGARDKRIEHLESRMLDTRVALDDALQQAQGVDVAKVLMDLNNADTTYRAALQVGARVLPPTLADFLR